MKQGIEFFLKRLKNYYQVNVVETRAARFSQREMDQAAKQEARHLAKALSRNRDFLVVLDMTGREMSSEELASFLKKRQEMGINSFCFLVGGAYGVTEEIKRRANLVLSLSKMTFTHEMARLILAEQLYRAASINAGSPYHH